MVHILWKLGLENFEHYFTRMWDKCNGAVVCAFFGIAFLWDWNENWPFPVLWPLLSFPDLLHIEGSTFTASSFRIWNSTGIPSPPLGLFIVMLPKVHLTSHFRMSGSRWVTPLSGSWRSFFVQFFCVFLSPPLLLLGPYYFCPLLSPPLHEMFPLYLWFSKRDLYSFLFYYFPLFLCTDNWGRLSYLFLLFSGTLHSNGYLFPFLLCVSLLFFSQMWSTWSFIEMSL